MIVSDVPGTTRDAIDSIIQFEGKTFTVIDTAGLRKKSRISQKVEEYSVASALRSIERADVVNLVIDGAGRDRPSGWDHRPFYRLDGQGDRDRGEQAGSDGP